MRIVQFLHASLAGLLGLMLTGAAAWAGAGGITGSGTDVPEPASLAVLAIGVAGALAARRARRKR